MGVTKEARSQEDKTTADFVTWEMNRKK